MHGSMGWSEETFQLQAPLAERFRLELLDRRGMGRSPDCERVDFERDAEDIVTALGDGAHLVGHSYGALGCLLAAGRRPEAVRSLTVIEPLAFSLAPEDPAVRSLVARLAPVYPAAPGTDPDRFYNDFLAAFGLEGQEPGMFTPEDERAVRASMRERPPWEAQVDVAALAAAAFPLLVVSDTWEEAPPAARDVAARAILAVCDALVAATGAQRASFPGAGHHPQVWAAEAFNERLAAFVEAAEAGATSTPAR